MLWSEKVPFYDYRSLQTFTKIMLEFSMGEKFYIWEVSYTGCHNFMVIWLRTGSMGDIGCTYLYTSLPAKNVQFCTPNPKCTNLYNLDHGGEGRSTNLYAHTSSISGIMTWNVRKQPFWPKPIVNFSPRSLPIYDKSGRITSENALHT